MIEKLSTSDFQFVRNMVRDKSAMVIEDNKAYLVEARLTMLLKHFEIETLPELVSQLRTSQNSRLSSAVIDAMTINETSFFRDVHPFEALRKEVIPTLIKNREKEACLNIWCGAASTGQEPYSIAMVLKENFPKILQTWKVRIIATDICDDVLNRARSGTFTQLEVNRGLPVTMLMKYFQKSGMQWQLKDEITKMVEFHKMNLIEPWPPLPKMDMIFLRNVLIYFDVNVKKSILGKVHHLLNKDGFFFLGTSETTLNLSTQFERKQLPGSFCYYPLS